MKVVVTSLGPELDGKMDPRFGRASWFLAVDTEKGTVEAMDNTRNRDAAQGAGVSAAQAVLDLKADALVSSHVGPRAFQVLAGAGVKVYSAPEGVSCREAVDLLKAGKLKELAGPDVNSHW